LLVAGAYLAIAVAIVAARPPEPSGPIARDFEADWSAGAAFDRHADPYAAGIWRDEQRVPGVDPQREGVLPFISPPPALLLWSLFARLPYAVAAPLWLTLLACALAVLIVASIRGTGEPLDLRNGIAALALAVAFGPISSDLALGQIALLAAAGACALVVGAPRSYALTTVGGVLACAQPNVLPALVSQLTRKRAVIAIGIAIIVTYVLGVMASGWNWIARYAAALSAHGSAERFSAIQMTPAALAYGLGASRCIASFAAILVAVAAIIFAGIAAMRMRDAFTRFAAFAALTPFVAPFWHEHDFVMAFPAAIWCALRIAGPLRAIAMAGSVLLGVDWLGLAQRPGGILQSALLAIAAWCAFTALGYLGNGSTLDGGRRRLAYSYATLALVALFAGASVIAIAHPAPVWPAAMHAIVLPANATAAQLWGLQQHATGLDRPVASWAALRALSLAGCALLAGAIYSHSTYCRTA
jgi:hypothetical protein